MNLFARKPYLIAIVISILLTAWLLSGYTAEKPQIAEKAPPKEKPLFNVQVHEYQTQTLTKEILVTGRTQAKRITTLRAEINSKITKLPVERGKKVKKGNIIAKLAIKDRQLSLQEAQAFAKQRQLEYDAAKKLAKKGFQSKTQIATALSALQSAKTQVKQAEIELDSTKIHAPHTGILVERPVEEGDYVSIGDVVAQILDEDPFLAVGEVSELERAQIHLGDEVSVHLITGERLTGKLSRIAMLADPNTRTFKIEVEVPNPKGILADGITSELRIPIESVLAHNIPASLLSLDDAGVLGVKAVNENDQVVFHPAKLAKATSKGIWLMNLPEKVKFITVGQGFVNIGDTVNPVLN